MMKRYSLPLFFTLVALVVTGCTYDPAFEGLEEVSVNYRGDPVDAFLDITVGELSVSMETRAEDEADPYEDTEAERWVNDIWVFQYDATDKTAIADPIFISISESTEGYDQEILKNLPVTLSDNNGNTSLIYVVANAGSDETWGSNFENETLLLSATLHTREPVMVTKETTNGDLSIPMEGNSEAVQVVANTVVRVPVTRMYAKIMIDPYLELQNSEIYSVGVGSIPLYCQVGSLWTETNEGKVAATYPSDVQWISRTFTESLVDEDGYTSGPDAEDLGYRYIMYVPENLSGQTEGTNKMAEDAVAPARALQVNIVIKYTDAEGGTIEYPYTFYPGANTTNDYNIKRNNIYRVKANIRTISLARVPSANCFFAFAGETISFYPYYREETSGGYDFSSYLNPYGAEDAQTTTGAKIDHVGIVWQTKDCIGDNSAGALVWFSAGAGAANLSQTGYEQIYVQTHAEGNALIAAYDKENNIIWSWHIWVRSPGKKDPTNEANAILYYTYDWDESGIYSYDYSTTISHKDRVAGYEIMSCNLGALEDEPNYSANSYFGYHYDDGSSGSDPYGKSTDPYRVQTFQSGDNIVRTFGMLYQWGRKDPFPPMISSIGATSNSDESSFDTGYYVHDYSNEKAHTEQLYGNDNEEKVYQTSYGDSNYLFHSHLHDATADGITGVRYSIAHPTVFLCGTETPAGSFYNGNVSGKADNTDYVKSINNYPYKGAWSDEDHDNCEWGGSDPTEAKKSLALGIYDDVGNPVVIYDDYEGVSTGESKSIFDPCPYGWRVGSGDLWLGFTKNGINGYNSALDVNKSDDGDGGSMDNVNYVPEKSCLLGMTMYMGTADNSWRAGETSWFPNQGFLLPDGCGYRVGACGNYTNANADEASHAGGSDRVNIIHTHDRWKYFRQFEVQLHYTVKSAANPLRCVRDQL